MSAGEHLTSRGRARDRAAIQPARPTCTQAPCGKGWVLRKQATQTPCRLCGLQRSSEEPASGAPTDGSVRGWHRSARGPGQLPAQGSSQPGSSQPGSATAASSEPEPSCKGQTKGKQGRSRQPKSTPPNNRGGVWAPRTQRLPPEKERKAPLSPSQDVAEEKCGHRCLSHSHCPPATLPSTCCPFHCRLNREAQGMALINRMCQKRYSEILSLA